MANEWQPTPCPVCSGFCGDTGPTCAEQATPPPRLVPDRPSDAAIDLLRRVIDDVDSCGYESGISMATYDAIEEHLAAPPAEAPAERKLPPLPEHQEFVWWMGIEHNHKDRAAKQYFTADQMRDYVLADRAAAPAGEAAIAFRRHYPAGGYSGWYDAKCEPVLLQALRDGGARIEYAYAAPAAPADDATGGAVGK